MSRLCLFQIRVNSIHPTTTNTPINKGLEDKNAFVLERTSLGRFNGESFHK